MARRRSGLGWLLVILFIGVPLVEIYVIIQVGQAIGPWWTILLLVIDSILGSWLIRHEGGARLAGADASRSTAAGCRPGSSPTARSS